MSRTASLLFALSLPGCGGPCLSPADDDAPVNLAILCESPDTHSSSASTTSGSEGNSETSDPTEESTGLGDSTSTGSDVSDQCVRLLFSDLQPADGSSAKRAVAVTAERCEAPQDGVLLQIGPGVFFDVMDPDDTLIHVKDLSAGGCSVLAGAKIPNSDPLFLPDGVWPQYHILLLQKGSVVDGMVFETPHTQPLRADVCHAWHEVRSYDGSCALIEEC